MSHSRQEKNPPEKHTLEENFINVVGFQCLDHLQNNAVDIFLSTCGVQNCLAISSVRERETFISFILSAAGRDAIRQEAGHIIFPAGISLLFSPGQKYTIRQIPYIPGIISGSVSRE